MSHVGRTYGPETYAVSAEEADAFAEATDDPHDHGRAVPPMFAVVYAREAVAEMLFDPDLGLDLANLVHGEQDLAFHAPVHVGDTVRTEGELVQHETKGDNLVVALETTSTVDGDVVSKGQWRFVIRGAGE